MIILRVNDRMLPGRVIMAEGLILTYQGDSNLVLYRGTTPVWATMTADNPGFVVMQGDGNLVMYNADGIPIWATNTNAPGAVLSMDRNGLDVVALEPTVLWSTPELPGPGPEPIPEPGNVRKLVGEARPFGRSFGDDTGPCIIHGCSDFGGIVKHHENRDASLRSLDITASHQQFLRVAWRLNGWLWTPSGLTIDPIRDVWWDSTLFDYGNECRQRGLRLVLSCMDMFNWTDSQARDAFETMAHIARELGDTVIQHEWNELRFTSPGGENDARKCEDLLRLYQSIYPKGLRGISDPGSQDKEGMQKLSQPPANTAIIHNVRHGAVDAMRRAFNAPYENQPVVNGDELGIDEGEPTGPENPNPGGLYGGHVFQPTENHDDLLGIYTTLVLTGQKVTYFNDPALVSRMPLDSTWGFKEIPALWKLMEIPENVGQGTLIPGHRSNAPVRLTPGPAEARADSVVIDGQSFTRLCGGAKTVAGRSGTLTAFRASGVIHEQPISEGQTIPFSDHTPTIIRIR